jgi:hypothetical protein
VVYYCFGCAGITGSASARTLILIIIIIIIIILHRHITQKLINILPLIISATGVVPQSLFKNLKILDLENTLVVESPKGILLYSCHIVRKFLNIDTEHNTQQSQNAEARRR